MIDPPPLMVNNDHPRANMWRKERASVVHRNACRALRHILGNATFNLLCAQPHKRLKASQQRTPSPATLRMMAIVIASSGTMKSVGCAATTTLAPNDDSRSVAR